MNRQLCLEKFRRSHRKTEAIEQNLAILKAAHDKGRNLAKEAIDVRNKIKEYTNKIEDIRRMEALKKINRAVGDEETQASHEEKEF